jgi:hypothetical protein
VRDPADHPSFVIDDRDALVVAGGEYLDRGFERVLGTHGRRVTHQVAG